MRKFFEIGGLVAAAVRPGRRQPRQQVGQGRQLGGADGRTTQHRTVLVDQAYPGEAPGLYDLLWYVALNRQRLPVSKEATILAYRAGLEAAGIDTGDWFERQLGLSIIAIMATFAWEKALGDAEELAWWSSQVARARAWLP